VLFALINYARFIEVNPIDALERTNKRFIKRFQIMESKLKEEGKDLSDMNLEEMEKYWQWAKNEYLNS
jgi:XTP/dITP diphosphohydrolase